MISGLTTKQTEYVVMRAGEKFQRLKTKKKWTSRWSGVSAGLRKGNQCGCGIRGCS